MNGAMLALCLSPIGGAGSAGNKLHQSAALANNSAVLMNGAIINNITQNLTN
jgi:hypothetical protein